MSDSQHTALPVGESALRTPASRRLSLPVSVRLSTITEANNVNAAPPIPPRSSKRRNTSASSTSWRGRSPVAVRFSALPSTPTESTSTDTRRTAPPPYYAWKTESADSIRHPVDPVEEEKFQALRLGIGHVKGRPRRRGGFWRLALVVVVALVVIGLAVGLGVGLTAGKRSHSDANSQSSTGSSSGDSSTSFPLGEYSLITALSDVSTDCTSKSATWNCYPYTVYNASVAGTNTSSLSAFNWIITNTSATYATTSTGSTSDKGVAANLSISTANDPFSLVFSNQPLTYISEASNTTSPRYTFSFTMSKLVTPRSAITTDDTAAECFFNQTTLTATLYLTAARDYPSAALADSNSLAGYTQWPYAVEVAQTSAGGENVPACYEYTDGAVGARITTGLTAQSSDAQCVCDYRNF